MKTYKSTIFADSNCALDMIPSFDILISEEDFNLLLQSGKICRPAEDRTGMNSNANFARALSWITNSECAIPAARAQVFLLSSFSLRVFSLKLPKGGPAHYSKKMTLIAQIT